MKNKYIATETEPTPVVAVASNQKPTNRKDKAMPIKDNTSKATDPTPKAPAVDSKPTTHKLKIFTVLVLLTFYLREFKIAAQTKTEAKKLAAQMVRRLSHDQIEAISTGARLSEDPNIVELFGVYKMVYDIPGCAWTRADIESEAFAELVDKAAAKMSATNAIREQFDAMTPKQHASMKRKLFRLAEVGADKPAADTLEGYAFAQYTGCDSLEVSN